MQDRLRFLHIAVIGLCALCMVAGSAFAQTGALIYDNGVSGTVNTGLSSQHDSTYPFESAVADDFMLQDIGGSGLGWDVSGVSFTGLQFNDPPDFPDSAPFSVFFYADNGLGTAPLYTGDGTVSPDLDAIGSAFATLTSPESAPGPYSYGFDFASTILLDPSTKYWLSIQADTIFPPQWGWQGDNTGGGNAMQGFPLLGIPFWTPVSPGTEMDFQLYGSRASSAIPEPATGLLLLGGLAGLAARRRRRR